MWESTRVPSVTCPPDMGKRCEKRRRPPIRSAMPPRSPHAFTTGLIPRDDVTGGSLARGRG
jgi:hypothetical protein